MNPSVADTIVEYFMPLFSTWGYLIVFGGAFLESIIVIGWLAPGTTVILLGSFYAAQGELNIVLVGVCAVLGAFLGDNVGYVMGWKGGDWVLDRYGERKRIKEGLRKTEDYFRRFGGATVFFGRMVTGVDVFIPFAAGVGSMRYRRYIAYDIPAILLWVGILCTLGYLFGDNWEAIDNFLSYMGWGLLAILIAITLIYYLIKRRKKRKEAIVEEKS
jgi:membrane-associated protein